MCSNQNCDMVSCCLQKLEKEILKQLRIELINFNYYIENYEEEIIKERVDTKKSITKINNKLDGLKTELKNALRNYNKKEIGFEEYSELRKDINEEMEVLKAQLQELENDEEVDTLTRYKKQSPYCRNA